MTPIDPIILELTFQSLSIYVPPALTFRNCILPTMRLCVLRVSENKQQLFLYTA